MSIKLKTILPITKKLSKAEEKAFLKKVVKRARKHYWEVMDRKGLL